MTNEEFEKVCKEFIPKLMEHCDSVRVIATEHRGDQESTNIHSTGAGNIYAQLGAVKCWLVQQDQHERELAKGATEE